MATTIGEATSRIRNTIKAVKSDAFITDRYLYSMLIKYGKALMRRQGTLDRILKSSYLFKTIPCMDLVEVNKVEACCGGVKSDCLFKRTEAKVPNMMDGEYGPIFRTISSIDGSIEIFPTTPSSYTSMSKTSGFKYNKNYYYWYLNGYLYFPNLPWEAVSVQGIFEGDLNSYLCPDKSNENGCIQRQDQEMSVPDFLFAEVEQAVLKELGIMISTPPDLSPDKQSNTR